MYGSMAVISWFSAASDWEVLKSKNPISVTMRGQPTMILLSWSWKTRLISKSFPGLWHLCVFLTPRESTMARRWQKSFWNNWPIQWYIYVLMIAWSATLCKIDQIKKTFLSTTGHCAWLGTSHRGGRNTKEAAWSRSQGDFFQDIMTWYSSFTKDNLDEKMQRGLQIQEKLDFFKNDLHIQVGLHSYEKAHILLAGKMQMPVRGIVEALWYGGTQKVDDMSRW